MTGRDILIAFERSVRSLPHIGPAPTLASYARTVNSRHESNGKKKGEGNTKCGNKHLAWAFVEAAHFAVRYDAQIKRWYQKKVARTLPVVAIKGWRTSWHALVITF